MAAIGIVLVCTTGCKRTGRGAAGTTAATRDTYEIVTDAPGTPLEYSGETDPFHLSARLPGVTLQTNICSRLELSDTSPRLIISGRQSWENLPTQSPRTKLRVDSVQTPSGTSILQVDVSLGSPLELRVLRSSEKGTYTPGPLLHDDIDTTYWPVGYFHRDGSRFEVNLDPADAFKDLNELPYLSRSKEQELYLVFFVNRGVTITGFSYGGHDKRTFELQVPDR